MSRHFPAALPVSCLLLAAVATAQTELVDSALEDSIAFVRLPEVTDSLLQIKLDSISRNQGATTSEWDTAATSPGPAPTDPAEAFAKAAQKGEYVERVGYDKGNFDHWRIDTVLQKSVHSKVEGEWRTAMLPHGHAFRDAWIHFRHNDTLASTTFTYADSGRYQKTGEYSFRARYRFDSDSTFRTREVFPDRGVVRWDYVTFRIQGDTLRYRLDKLEFRDLNDNWLDASQNFANVPDEVYFRTAKAAQPKGVQAH